MPTQIEYIEKFDWKEAVSTQDSGGYGATIMFAFVKKTETCDYKSTSRSIDTRISNTYATYTDSVYSSTGSVSSSFAGINVPEYLTANSGTAYVGVWGTQGNVKYRRKSDVLKYTIKQKA